MNDYHQLIASTVSAQAERLNRLIDYIEIGVLTGNSAKSVLSTGKCRYAVLIDNFSNTHCGDVKSSREIVEENLLPYFGLFELKEGNSSEELLLITDKFDIAFIDGEHTDQGCQSDLEKTLRLMRSYGIMFVDDLENPPSLHDVVRRFANENNLNFIYHNVHNGLGELSWPGKS